MLAAVLDSCVLFPNTLRDVLLTVAENEFYRPLWSSEILAEVRRNVLATRSVAPESFDRTLRLMSLAFEDAEVRNWQEHIPKLDLPDPDDRHVLATAIVGEAPIIVTANLKDFPAESLAPYRIQAVHPDDVLLEQLDTAPSSILRILEQLADKYRKPPLDLSGLLTRLDRAGVIGFAEEVRRLNS